MLGEDVKSGRFVEVAVAVDVGVAVVVAVVAAVVEVVVSVVRGGSAAVGNSFGFLVNLNLLAPEFVTGADVEEEVVVVVVVVSSIFNAKTGTGSGIGVRGRGLVTIGFSFRAGRSCLSVLVFSQALKYARWCSKINRSLLIGSGCWLSLHIQASMVCGLTE